MNALVYVKMCCSYSNNKIDCFLPIPPPKLMHELHALYPLSLKKRCCTQWTSAFWHLHWPHLKVLLCPFTRTRTVVGFESHPGQEDTTEIHLGGGHLCFLGFMTQQVLSCSRWPQLIRMLGEPVSSPSGISHQKSLEFSKI